MIVFIGRTRAHHTPGVHSCFHYQGIFIGCIRSAPLTSPSPHTSAQTFSPCAWYPGGETRTRQAVVASAGAHWRNRRMGLRTVATVSPSAPCRMVPPASPTYVNGVVVRKQGTHVRRRPRRSHAGICAGHVVMAGRTSCAKSLVTYALQSWSAPKDGGRNCTEGDGLV